MNTYHAVREPTNLDQRLEIADHESLQCPRVRMIQDVTLSRGAVGAIEDKDGIDARLVQFEQQVQECLELGRVVCGQLHF